MSLFTGFKTSLLLASSFFKSLISFCLALLNEAKLLPFFSISSLFKALDTVSFNSLLLNPDFPSLFFVGVSHFNLFVARCSASFLIENH
jgi:hypothetical protein